MNTKIDNNIVLPSNLVNNPNLIATDLNVYSYLQYLKQKGQEICDYPNSRLAKEFDVSTRTIERSLKRLEKEGFIIREVTDNNKRQIYA